MSFRFTAQICWTNAHVRLTFWIELPSSTISSLTASDAQRLIGEGAISEGMIPKVEACLETIECGVRKVHIIDGRLRHSLLLETFTTDGIGTVIAKES